MEERERAHATQLQRAERESTSLRGEIKQIRSRMEAAIHQAAESDQLRAQIRERYFLTSSKTEINRKIQLSFQFYSDVFSDSNFARLRCVIDEKAIENDTLRRRLTDAHEQAKKTVDKDLAKNIVLKYLSLPGMSQNNNQPVQNYKVGCVFPMVIVTILPMRISGQVTNEDNTDSDVGDIVMLLPKMVKIVTNTFRLQHPSPTSM